MYLLIGEILAVVTVGGLTGIGTDWLTSPEWHMLSAMLAGMLIGMVLQIPVYLIFMPLFGAFEIMVPAMLTGMAGGMLSGMLGAFYRMPEGIDFLIGAGVGIIVWQWVTIRNLRLQGEVK